MRSALACSRVLEYAKIWTVLQFTSTALTILLDKGTDHAISKTRHKIYIYLYSVIEFLL